MCRSYLKGEDSVTLDFTGVIGISGRHRHLKNFVIPITWRSHRSYLIICLERASERDARGLS